MGRKQLIAALFSVAILLFALHGAQARDDLAGSVQVRFYFTGTVTETAAYTDVITWSNHGDTSTETKTGHCTATFDLTALNSGQVTEDFSKQDHLHALKDSGKQIIDNLATETGSYSGPLSAPNVGGTNEEISGPSRGAYSYFLDPVARVATVATYNNSETDPDGTTHTSTGRYPHTENCRPSEARPFIGTVNVGQPEVFASQSHALYNEEHKVIGTVVETASLHLVVVVSGTSSSDGSPSLTRTPIASRTPSPSRTPLPGHVVQGPITDTPTSTPTATTALPHGGISSATSTSTPTSIQPVSLCMPQKGSLAPIATESKPGGLGDQPAQRATAPHRPSTQATIVWSASRPLTWNDFKGNYRTEPNPVNRQFDAQTNWQVVFGVGLGKYCLPPPGAAATVTIPVMLPDEDARFVPGASWVKPGKQSNDLLTHEQGHFNIAEVYQRRIRLLLTADLGAYLSPGGKTLNFPCAATPPCPQQVQAFLAPANRDGARLYQIEQAEQARYDRETDHSRIATAQQHWTAEIADCLAQVKPCTFLAS